MVACVDLFRKLNNIQMKQKHKQEGRRENSPETFNSDRKLREIDCSFVNFIYLTRWIESKTSLIIWKCLSWCLRHMETLWLKVRLALRHHVYSYWFGEQYLTLCDLQVAGNVALLIGGGLKHLFRGHAPFLLMMYHMLCGFLDMSRGCYPAAAFSHSAGVNEPFSAVCTKTTWCFLALDLLFVFGKQHEFHKHQY